MRVGKAVTCAAGLGLLVTLLVQMGRRPTSLVIGYMVVLAMLGALLLTGLVRAFRVGIELTDAAVVARSTFRTRSFAWDDVVSAVPRDRSVRHVGRTFVGLTPAAQAAQHQVEVIPQLRLTSGRLVRLRGLQVHLSSDAAPNWLDDAMREINLRLAARRDDDAEASPATPS
jgi:hypothetical protein